MNTIIFSGATINSWIFSIFLCVITPLCFLWFFKKKTGAKITSFLIGIGFSLLFSFIIYTVLNIILLQIFGLGFLFRSDNHPVFTFLYDIIIAGLMAFAGCLLGLKHMIKKHPDKNNALLFGLGMGSFECMMNCGAVYITNIIAAVFINSIGSNEYFSKLNLSAAELKQTYSSFALLASTPAHTYIIQATYFLLLLCVHTALAIMLYPALQKTENQKAKHLLPLVAVLQILGYVPIYLANIPSLQNSMILLTGAFIFTFILSLLSYQLYQKIAK